MSWIVVVLLLGLGFVIVGGLVARGTITGVKLTTAPGALLGLVGICQFLLYLFSVVPIAILLFYFTIPEDDQHRAFSFDHSFRLELPVTNLQISDVRGFSADATQITNLQADMSIAGSDAVVTALLVTMTVSLWMLVFLFLKSAKLVMRSLYDRTPFVAENPRRLRQMASLTLAIWLVYAVYAVAMTLYLQSVLEVSNGRLLPAELPVLAPLVIAGLFVVLAEVFRVGFELKQENALTV